MNKSTVMIYGYGSVGQYVLDMILRNKFMESKIDKVVVVSRTEKPARLNTSIIASRLAGITTEVVFEKCDFNNEYDLTCILTLYNPKYIIQCARFYSGHKYGAYSYSRGIGYGVWAPMSVIPIMKLMQAVRSAGLEGKSYVINTSYPDITNYWLRSAGLAVPFTGAGNVSHLVPRIYESMKDSGIHLSEIRLACHHYTNTYVSKEGWSKGSKYILEVKGEVVPHDLCEEVFRKCSIPMETGQVRNLMVATDCYRILEVLILDLRGSILHLPGYKGAIGGAAYVYKGEEVFESAMKSSEREIQIANMSGAVCDGVDKIIQGNLYYTDQAIESMKEHFGLDYNEPFSLNNIESEAAEIVSKLDGYNG